jgi:post-segregation antitoxin (ccd killing protein)
MVTQGVLDFQYQPDTSKTGQTANAGLGLYLDLAFRSGLVESVRRHLSLRRGGQGWTDEQMVLALVLLNLAGGESVSDLEVLEADEGFSRLLRRVEQHGLSRQERRQMERRWRKERTRSVPSATAVFRYLAGFENEGYLAQAGRAVIPAPSQPLRGLRRVNAELVGYAQQVRPRASATLDMDATLSASNKREALLCYQGMRAYQPHNVWWAEQGMMLHTEFRDGNVPAGHEQLRVLKDALAMVPAGVQQVFLRSDSAGYQQEILEYCAEGGHERFGVVEFAVSADVTEAFRAAVRKLDEEDWRTLHRLEKDVLVATEQQWAEVCFVPNWAARSKKQPEYRFLAIREPLKQPALPGMQANLPFPVEQFGAQPYKLFGLVSNRTGEGEQIIRWHRERCGKSEEAHAVMKQDLAGGRFPSGSFGENAAWWQIMVLALNLNTLLKREALGEGWVNKRLKALRYALIGIPGKLVERARGMAVRICARHPAWEVLLRARGRILALPAPAR